MERNLPLLVFEKKHRFSEDKNGLCKNLENTRSIVIRLEMDFTFVFSQTDAIERSSGYSPEKMSERYLDVE